MEERPMSKRVKRCCSDCQHHQLSLKSTNKEQSKISDCEVKFCPKYSRQPKAPSKIYPIFNNDRKYYTSGFILQIDGKALKTNQAEELAQHKRQITESLEKQTKINFPKPRKANTTCYVCKMEYKSYFKHIISQEHKQNIIESSYNSLILELTEHFKYLHAENAPLPIEIVNIAADKSEKVEKSNQCAQKEITEIIELLISSDSSEEDQEQTSKSNKSQVDNKQSLKISIFSAPKYESKKEPSSSSHSEKRQPSQASSESDSSNDKSAAKKQQQSSDTVEIIKVKPAKKKPDVLLQQPENGKTKKIKKKYKKGKKKLKREKKEKKKLKKEKKEKKEKKSKHKKNKKKNVEQDQVSSESSSDSMRRRKNSIKRRPLDPPPISPPVIHQRMAKMAKKAYRGGQRPAHPAELKTQEVLIEKYVVQDPVLDQSMQKILQNLLHEIGKQPPAQAPRQYRRANESVIPRLTHNNRTSVITRKNIQTMTQKQAQFLKNNVVNKSAETVPNGKSSADILRDIERQAKAREGWNKLTGDVLSQIMEDQNKSNKEQEIIVVAEDHSPQAEQNRNKVRQNSRQISSKDNSEFQRKMQSKAACTSQIQPSKQIPSIQTKSVVPFHVVKGNSSKARPPNSANNFSIGKNIPLNIPLNQYQIYAKPSEANPRSSSKSPIDLSLNHQKYLQNLMSSKQVSISSKVSPEILSLDLSSDDQLSIIGKADFLDSKKK